VGSLILKGSSEMKGLSRFVQRYRGMMGVASAGRGTKTNGAHLLGISAIVNGCVLPQTSIDG